MEEWSLWHQPLLQADAKVAASLTSHNHDLPSGLLTHE